MSWSTPFLNENEEWKAFHRLEPIFQKRKRHWSAFIHASPLWVRAATGGLLFLILDKLAHTLFPGAMSAHPVNTHAAIIAIFLIALLSGYRQTSLTPRYSWEPSPIRKLLVEKTVPIILAALLGVLGTLLTQFLIRKIWPSH